MNSLRIAIVVSAFPKTSETFIVNKVLGLLQRGLDIVICCDSSECKEWKRFQNVTEQYLLRSKVRRNWPHQPKYLFGFFIFPALLGSLIRNFKGTISYLIKGFRQWNWTTLKHFYLDSSLIAAKPDIIHFEFGALAVNRMYLREFLNCHISVSFRGYDLNFSGHDQPGYYKEVWEKADGIHCLGKDLWTRAKRLGCSSGKFHMLIPPAIDTQSFSPGNFAQHTKKICKRKSLRILSVGRLEWKKGYEYSLEAIRLLRDQGIDLEYHIIGEGFYLEALAFCRYQLALEGCVHFLGPMGQEAIQQEMSQADIFLHSSVTEGFCNAVLEAQAMELPVVCTDAGGLPENVEDGVTGFVVPSRAPQTLAEKLRILAKAPKLRSQMGKAGRQRVLARFDLPTQLNAFEEFFFIVENARNQGENSWPKVNVHGK